MAAAWRADLEGDGTPEHVIRRRLEKSDALLGEAPAIVVPCVRLRGAHAYRDEERAAAEREMFLLAGGAGIQNLLLALHAQRLGSCWVSSTLFCKEEARDALGLDDDWIPLGSVAVGPMPDGTPPDRPPLPVDEVFRLAE
jgi:coenzyme F420-0:L-glutamate ligase/coenzyme F420-1:gamma-L-glutamate ligase